jgi:protein-disulfide isomerase
MEPTEHPQQEHSSRPIPRHASHVRFFDVLLLLVGCLAVAGSAFSYMRSEQVFDIVKKNQAALLPSDSQYVADDSNGQAALAERVEIAVDADDPSMGNPQAPVTLVEFSDFECPFCGKFYETMKKVREAYSSDQVRFVYRDFPLTEIHDEAEPAAIAAQCVFDQVGSEGFFKYHDALFEQQEELGTELYASLAATITGVDMTTFEKCLVDPAIAAEIKKDVSDGEEAGVQGTPTTFVNGLPLNGAVPFSDVKEAIDKELGITQ